MQEESVVKEVLKLIPEKISIFKNKRKEFQERQNRK